MRSSRARLTEPEAPLCGDLACSLLDVFHEDVRFRGAETYRDGLVQKPVSGSTLLAAQVYGNQLYEVKLIQAGTQLNVSCTCPFFQTKGLCRHLWAVVLAAGPEALTGLADLPGPVPLLDARNLQKLAEFFPCRADKYRQQVLVDEWFDVFDLEPDDGLSTSEPGDFAALAEGRGHLALPARPAPPQPNWRRIVATIAPYQAAGARAGVAKSASAPVRWQYVIDLSACLQEQGGLVVRVVSQTAKKNGTWGKPKSVNVMSQSLETAPAADRELLVWLKAAGFQPQSYGYHYGYHYGDTIRLAGETAVRLLPKLCATGRFRVVPQLPAADGPPLQMDENPEPWAFAMALKPHPTKPVYLLAGQLKRGAEVRPLGAPLLLLQDGWAIWPERISRLECRASFPWIVTLRRHQAIEIPVADGDVFLETVLGQAGVPALTLPAALQCECVRCQPAYCLHLTAGSGATSTELRGKLGFDYQGLALWDGDQDRSTFDRRTRKYWHRDLDAESAGQRRLLALGFRRPAWEPMYYSIEAKKLPAAVTALVEEGWEVKAKGQLFRKPGDFSFAVASGLDWFELTATCDFEGVALALPELLAAVKGGQTYVTLGDGSLGILPATWLKQYGPMVSLGELHDDKIRFRRSQAMIIDALLAAQPEASCDEVFRRVRAELRSFDGIRPGTEPAGFVGVLRPYQKFGLGWFQFLEKFAFGGCLADDMGLGKTVQVLALLQARAGADRPAAERRASLAVMPRSLIFNWQREAERFAPALRVIDHTGGERVCQPETWAAHDLVVTTYGTLKRDIERLREYEFDYVILDEAQAIKTASTQTAKAVRLLRARHRLALSGTPIENHLGELWSLFEFLNPGMLGQAAVFLGTGAKLRNPEPETRDLIARALRPFLLRRTKRQVAPDLPEKTEKTLMCELEGEQKKLYDQLRDYYRQSLLAKVSDLGLGKSKIMVLEALLRLRQAACHPGLLDQQRVTEGSAKLEALLAQLQAVTDEGHKALVFSQFVSFLEIVKPHLEKAGIVYEYLDGRTRDREARVQRFQTDPACKLFLISLKAGGLGLNLTAAEYVFLLDPWWNPAVEAQAIDRTHRIGQTEKVFAYRLIAKDTVEEKVLQLQRTKRDLADAVITADGSVLANLTREDLELLLG